MFWLAKSIFPLFKRNRLIWVSRICFNLFLIMLTYIRKHFLHSSAFLTVSSFFVFRTSSVGFPERFIFILEKIFSWNLFLASDSGSVFKSLFGFNQYFCLNCKTPYFLRQSNPFLCEILIFQEEFSETFYQSNQCFQQQVFIYVAQNVF